MEKKPRDFLQNLLNVGMTEKRFYDWQTVGGTDTERRRVAPGLVHFYNNLPP